MNFFSLRNPWTLIILIASVFFGTQIYFYYELIFNGDGAYVFQQMRELILGRHFDLLYKGVDYASITEPVFSALLSFFLPVSWSLILGYLAYYIAGYFLLRNIFTTDKRPFLALLLIFPLPVPFFQSYAALGGHTYTLFDFFLTAWLLSSPSSKTKDGRYKFSTYVLVGVFSGFAVYAYQLSKLVAVSALVTIIVNDLPLIFRGSFLKRSASLLLNFFVILATYRIGYLPKKLSTKFFPLDHLGAGPVKLVFSPEHLERKFITFKNMLSHLFSPVFSHNQNFSDLYNHNNYPVTDVITHHSAAGLVLAAVFILLFLVLATRRFVKKPSDSFNVFLFLNVGAFIAGYLMREDFGAAIEHESRYMLVLYFAVITGVLYLLDLKKTKYLFLTFTVLSLTGHAVIFQTTSEYLTEQSKSRSCTALNKSEIYSILRKLNPKAIAGTYWEVWPLSAVLKNNFVYDVRHNRFKYNNDETLKHKIVFVADMKDGNPLIKLNNLFPGRKFHSTQLGYMSFYFEDIPGRNWPEDVNKLVAITEKGPCTFGELTTNIKNRNGS